MPRVLALDLGARRIGVAVSDPGGVLATPVATLVRRGDAAADHSAIAELVREYDASCVVVGLPRSLDGTLGPAAAAVVAEVQQLAEVVDVPVETADERFTTVTAHAQLRAAGVAGRKRGAVVDQAAATVLLQSWLDQRRREDPDA